MIKWFYIISLISGACHSQKAIKGTIVDMKNNPVSYVSIGVLNANIGTYSLKDGSFNLEIPIRYLKDSIAFQHIGYKTKVLPIKYFYTQADILLEEETEILKEVVVRAKNTRLPKIYGIQKKNSPSKINIAKPYNGAEVAVLINPEGHQFIVKEIHLSVEARNLEDFVLRVKFYKVDKSSQKPGEVLNKREINEKFIKNKGTIKYLLTENLLIEEPFFLSFEWLANKQVIQKIKQYNKQIQKEIINKYSFDGCLSCSKVIYNNKQVHFVNSKSITLWKTKLDREDRKRLNVIESKIPTLSFHTIKDDATTYYRYASFGVWYKYSQTLIASVIGVD